MNSSANSGISFFSLLGLLFLGLKLTDSIDWDWLWVLSPFWIPLAVVLFCFTVLLIIHAYKNWKK